MRILTSIILLIVSNILLASNVDSLKLLLNNANEKEKLELYIELGKHYSKSYLDSSIYFSQMAISLAENSNNSLSKGIALKILGNANFYKGNLDKAKLYYNEALAIFLDQKELIEAGKMYNNLGSLFQRTGQNQDAFAMLEKAIEVYDLAGDENQKAAALTNMGLIHFRQGNYDHALAYFIRAFAIAKKHDNYKGMGNNATNLGALYHEWGKYPQALSSYTEALTYQNKSLDYMGMAITYNNIGLIYKDLGDYSEAISNISKALELRKKFGAFDLLGSSLTNLGDIYSEWEKLDIALDYYHDAIELQEQVKNKHILGIALEGIGNVYYELELFNKSLDSYMEASVYFEELEEKKEMAHTYAQIGKIYALKLINPEKGEAYLIKAEKLYNDLNLNNGLAEINYVRGIQTLNQNNPQQAIIHLEKSIAYHPYNYFQLFEVNKLMAKAYKLTNNTNRAIYCLNKALEYSDSIRIQENNVQSLLSESQFSIQKQKLDIEFTKEKEKLSQAKLENYKYLRTLIGALTILLITALVTLYLCFMKLLKKNEKLAIMQHEISNQKALQEQANNQILILKSDTENHKAFKSEFLANVGHELRTPLNAIIGYAKLMHATAPKDCNLKYLDNIIQASDNLVVIISEMLDYSKIEAGKMLIDKAPFNPVNIITQTISTLRIHAEEKSNALEIHIDPDMPQYVSGDQNHLSHILTNIIGNAIKFSKINTPVSIEAHCSKEGNNCILTFVIADQGIGIDKLQHEAIFKSFTQVKNKQHKKYSGTGLGLAIVQRLVELQEGSISLKSKTNEGTTFTIQIPYRIVNEPINANKIIGLEENNMKNENQEPINILLVEDNEINQELAKDTISSWGDYFLIDVAENGNEAIEALLIKPYDLILMDIQMPEMDGHEATIYIRNKMDEKIKNIPIIGMTAHALQSEKDLALNNGMNDYIIKPFNPNKLKQIILKSVINKIR